jgi:murein DD-endopeptidase MepM/ murein hydrolase activator NlpD
MARRNATAVPNVPNKKRYASKFPKRHLAIAASLSLALGAVALSMSSQDVAAKRRSQVVALPIAAINADNANRIIYTTSKADPVKAAAPLAEQAPATDAAPPAAVVATGPQASKPEWQTIKVHNGDSLSRLFQRVGLNDRALYQVMKNNDQAADLKKLHPGEELGFQLDNGQLQAIRYLKSPLETVYIEREGEAYTNRKVVRTPEVRLSFRRATINNNLFLAGDKAKLPHSIIMELANIFGGVIDFVYDPRTGDSFSVLYEELYLDGKKFDEGKILAASFNNRGTEYPAFYYTGSDGHGGYYNDQGISMRKAFLRAPVDFTRISSNFNPRRLHPIFKTKRPHRGIDYAASRGTPVFATGEGRVVRAGYSKANGNFLVIQHGEAFVTKYLHLHKKQVKQGQRVKQGQIIGQVGSTGYATGPHLHYEFLLNGVHRNPRTIHKKLPKANSIAKTELAGFKAALQPLQAQFASHGGTQIVATADYKKPNKN